MWCARDLQGFLFFIDTGLVYSVQVPTGITLRSTSSSKSQHFALPLRIQLLSLLHTVPVAAYWSVHLAINPAGCLKEGFDSALSIQNVRNQEAG